MSRRGTTIALSWTPERTGTPTWPLIAVAVIVLGVGAAACFASPKLGLVALALPAVPLLVLAPEMALLALVVILPFDTLGSLDESSTLSATRTVGRSSAWAIRSWC